MEKRISSPVSLPEDLGYEFNLRPRHFSEFIGQTKMKENLSIFIEAAAKRSEPLDHTLFSGPPGLGKTTMAYIIAREMGAELRATSGPAIERPGDLAGLLTNLKKGDVLFIDEIHRINRTVEEYLYGAMEDFFIDIITGEGPRANSIRLNLEPFTLIGATTRTGLLTSPLRSRFGINLRLNFYPEKELTEIIKRSSKILNIPIEEDAAYEIGRRSRGTPRIANRLLRRVRDFVQVKSSKEIITKILTLQALKMLGVDEVGLDEMDKRILLTIAKKFSGGPVGIKSLSVAIGEETDTIEEIYEPYLIQEGYIERTLKGRKVTEKGMKHLNN